MNKETSFNYLYETDTKKNTDKSSQNKISSHNSSNLHNILDHVNETVSADRRNSLVKSKSIGISITHNKSINHKNDSIDLDDDPYDDDYLNSYYNSLQSTSSIISVSFVQLIF